MLFYLFVDFSPNCDWQGGGAIARRGAQRPVFHVNKPKKTVVRAAKTYS
jgi:hypothetical protein